MFRKFDLGEVEVVSRRIATAVLIIPTGGSVFAEIRLFCIYYDLTEKLREFGNFCSGSWLWWCLFRHFRSRNIPERFPDAADIPGNCGRRGSADGMCGSFAKTCFSESVGVWSAKANPKVRFVIAFFVTLRNLRCAHNPEVGGSSPSSATITDTVNDTIVSFTVSFFIPTFTPK